MPYELPPNIDANADWRSRPFAVYDTETTGLDRDSRVVEIAIVRFDPDGRQLDEWSTLINPQMPIPAGAQKVNNISDKMVKDAPVFDEDIYNQIVSRFRDHTLVAFNMPYDHFILFNEAKRLGKPWGSFFGIDALVLSRQILVNLPGGYKQVNILKRLGIFDESNPNHRALQDVKDTGRLLFTVLFPRFLKKDVTFQAIWNRQVDLALQHEKRMKIRRAGKVTSQPWHELVKEL